MPDYYEAMGLSGPPGAPPTAPSPTPTPLTITTPTPTTPTPRVVATKPKPEEDEEVKVIKTVTTPPGYETLVEAGTTYLVKDGQYYRQFNGGTPTRVSEPSRLRTVRLYGVDTTTDKPEIKAETVTKPDMRPDQILVAMKEEGATPSALLDYAKEHPDAVRGAKASQLMKGLQAQFGEYEDLPGKEQFQMQVKMGYIPEGSEYAGFHYDPKLKEALWGFWDPKQIAEKAKVKTALSVLAPFKTNGSYDLQAAFAAGKGADVYAARALDLFTPEVVVEAQFGQIEASSLARAREDIAKVAPTTITVKDGKTYVDLGAALSAGVSAATLRLAGFDRKDVAEVEKALKMEAVAVATTAAERQAAQKKIPPLVITVEKGQEQLNILAAGKAATAGTLTALTLRTLGYEVTDAELAAWAKSAAGLEATKRRVTKLIDTPFGQIQTTVREYDFISGLKQGVITPKDLEVMGYELEGIKEITFQADMETKLEPYRKSEFDFTSMDDPMKSVIEYGKAVDEGAVTKEELVEFLYAPETPKEVTAAKENLEAQLMESRRAPMWLTMLPAFSQLWHPGEKAYYESRGGLGIAEQVGYTILDLAFIAPAVGWIAKTTSGALRVTAAGAKIASLRGLPGVKLALESAQKALLVIRTRIPGMRTAIKTAKTSVTTAQSSLATAKRTGDVAGIKYWDDVVKVRQANVLAKEVSLSNALASFKADVAAGKVAVKEYGTLLKTAEAGALGTRISGGAFLGSQAVLYKAAAVTKPLWTTFGLYQAGLTTYKLPAIQKALGQPYADPLLSTVMGYGMSALALGIPQKLVGAVKSQYELFTYKGRIPQRVITVPEKYLPPGAGMPKTSVRGLVVKEQLRAMEASSKAMEKLWSGAGTAIIPWPGPKGLTYKPRAEWQRAIPGSMISATPTGGAFDVPIYEVTAGREPAQYFAPWLFPQFTEASAIGITGAKPTALVLFTPSISEYPIDITKAKGPKAFQDTIERLLERQALEPGAYPGFKLFRTTKEPEFIVPLGTEVAGAPGAEWGIALGGELNLWTRVRPFGPKIMIQPKFLMSGPGVRTRGFTLLEAARLKAMGPRAELLHLKEKFLPWRGIAGETTWLPKLGLPKKGYPIDVMRPGVFSSEADILKEGLREDFLSLKELRLAEKEARLAGRVVESTSLGRRIGSLRDSIKATGKEIVYLEESAGRLEKGLPLKGRPYEAVSREARRLTAERSIRESLRRSLETRIPRFGRGRLEGRLEALRAERIERPLRPERAEPTRGSLTELRLPRAPREPAPARVTRPPREPRVSRVPEVPRVPRPPRLEEPRLPRERPPREEPPRERPPRERPPRVELKPPKEEIKIPPFLLKAKKAKKIVEEWPPGTIAWRQGMFWKVIPPPYDVDKPITLKEAPAGVTKFATGEGSASKTIQVLGGPAPNDVSIDLGVVDIFIKGGTMDPKITYKGGGTETDVGSTLPSPLMGITISEEPTAELRQTLKKTKRRQPQYSPTRRTRGSEIATLTEIRL